MGEEKNDTKPNNIVDITEDSEEEEWDEEEGDEEEGDGEEEEGEEEQGGGEGGIIGIYSEPTYGKDPKNVFFDWGNKDVIKKENSNVLLGTMFTTTSHKSDGLEFGEIKFAQTEVEQKYLNMLYHTCVRHFQKLRESGYPEGWTAKTLVFTVLGMQCDAERGTSVPIIFHDESNGASVSTFVFCEGEVKCNGFQSLCFVGDKSPDLFFMGKGRVITVLVYSSN